MTIKPTTPHAHSITGLAAAVDANMERPLPGTAQAAVGQGASKSSGKADATSLAAAVTTEIEKR